MKNVNLLFICIFLLSTTVYSQLNMQWSKTFGGSFPDTFVNAHNMNDGSFLLVGNTFSSDGDVSYNHGDPNNPSSDIWVVKVNNQGNIIWEYTIGGPGGDTLFDSKSTNDGGVILVGSKNGSAWIGKLNAEGNLIWENTFDFYNSLTAVTETLDEGYLVVGQNYDSGEFLKLNILGELETVFFEVGSSINSIISTDDGGYVVGSKFYDSYYHYGSTSIYKISSTGEPVWSSLSCYDNSSGPLQFYFVKQTTDNGYIFGDSCHLRKLDSDGSMEWERPAPSYDLVELEGNGYLTVAKGNVIQLRKINNIGEVEWWMGIQEEGDYSGSRIRILPLNDGGFIVAGRIETGVVENMTEYDFLVKKFDNDLSIVDIKEEFIKIYPNPVKHYLNFSKELTNIEIYNLEGAKILNFETSLQIDVSNIPSGTYLLKAIDLSGKNVFSKFIKK